MRVASPDAEEAVHDETGTRGGRVRKRFSPACIGERLQCRKRVLRHRAANRRRTRRVRRGNAARNSRAATNASRAVVPGTGEHHDRPSTVATQARRDFGCRRARALHEAGVRIAWPRLSRKLREIENRCQCWCHGGIIGGRVGVPAEGIPGASHRQNPRPAATLASLPTGVTPKAAISRFSASPRPRCRAAFLLEGFSMKFLPKTGFALIAADVRAFRASRSS
jgi:hypothetical protein